MVGIGRNKVLERRIAPLMDEAEAAFVETDQKQRLFGETDYAAPTGDRERRVIMMAERLLEGPNRRFVVTSLGASPQSVSDEGDTPRGDMKNRIKVQQLMLFADHTSCHVFQGNQFRLLLSSFEYVPLHHLRTHHLANTDLAPAQADRLRLTLIKIAARVRLTARRVVFHLSSSCPYQSPFRTAATSARHQLTHLCVLFTTNPVRQSPPSPGGKGAVHPHPLPIKLKPKSNGRMKYPGQLDCRNGRRVSG